MSELTILEIVKERYVSLSKSQKRIADCVLESWETVAFLSPGELGKRIGVSETTVIRFAQTLGYETFSLMREQCQNLLKNKLTPSEKMSHTVMKMRTEQTSLERLLSEEVENLKESIYKLSLTEFLKAVEAIELANRVFVVGQGVSESLCKFLEFRFRRMQIDTRSISCAGKAFYENLLLLDERDIVFGIGFFRCSKDILRGFDYANRLNVPTIALTHSTVSELALKAKITLVANRGPVSFLNSLVVPMAILNTLVLYIAEKDEKKMQALKKLDQLQDIFGLNGKE